jgi:hypothetical protein
MDKLKEAYEKAAGKKPADAPKLPKGWHYMPDGKVMKNSEHEEKEEEYEEGEEEMEQEGEEYAS